MTQPPTEERKSIVNNTKIFIVFLLLSLLFVLILISLIVYMGYRGYRNWDQMTQDNIIKATATSEYIQELLAEARTWPIDIYDTFDTKAYGWSILL